MSAQLLDVDLIFLDCGGERTLQAVAMLDDGTTESFGPVPFTGALGPLAEQLHARFGRGDDDLQQTQLRLTTVHFRNMSRGENAVGQSYPFKVPTS
jgi:hypothetical protein